jgi:hypothetical protein
VEARAAEEEEAEREVEATAAEEAVEEVRDMPGPTGRFRRHG